MSTRHSFVVLLLSVLREVPGLGTFVLGNDFVKVERVFWGSSYLG